MRNLKVIMAYNGTSYHGFQSQKNALAVQDVVEKRMSVLLSQPITIFGCSRTDTGVHAREFCFNSHIEHRITCDGFIRGMNTLLPNDIAILSCEDAPEEFHARFDTHEKEYLYLVNNARQRDVFTENLAFFYPYPLDEKKLTKISQMFVGEHDFAAFCKAEAKAHLSSTVRTINSFRVERRGDYVEFYVRGNGFLHNMVRILIGTLIFYSEGKRDEEDIRQSLLTGCRDRAGKTLSPCGLYLNRVIY